MSSVSNSCDRRIICVLGMHRSGTSLVTRLLNLLGVDLGVSAALRPADRFNPTGYWEHQAFIDINDELLRRLGGSWRQIPRLLSPGWENAADLDELADQARAALPAGGNFPRYWAWKDPRTCITLPFWRRTFGEIDCLLCLRNPVDVAHSLSHTMPFEVACRLWHGYVGASIGNTAGKPRQFVFYEDVLDAPETEIRRLAQWLGSDASANVEQAVAAAAQFLDRRREHHRTSSVGVFREARLAFPAKALYLALRQHVDACRAGSSVAIASPLEDETLDAMGVSSLEAQRSTENLQTSADDRQRELREALAAKKEVVSRLAAREQTLAARTTEIELARQARVAQEEATGAQHAQHVERLHRRQIASKRRLRAAEASATDREALARAVIELAAAVAPHRIDAPTRGDAPDPATTWTSPPATYDEVVTRIRALVEAKLPGVANVLVVSKGDDRLLQLGRRRGAHFPQDGNGAYAGHHPADSAAAIDHLESLRDLGAQYLVFPSTSLWWFDHYQRFKSHLDARYKAVIRDDAICVIYSLCPAGESAATGVAPQRSSRPRLAEQVGELVGAVLPPTASTLVISCGDEQMVRAVGAAAQCFPQNGSGVATVAQLERLRAAGAQFLVVPQSAMSWLAEHQPLRRHLNRNYRQIVCQRNVCTVYDLAPRNSNATPAKARRVAGNGRKPTRRKATPR